MAATSKQERAGPQASCSVSHCPGLALDAVTPPCHCKTGILDLPSEAVFPRLTDNCMGECIVHV